MAKKYNTPIRCTKHFGQYCINKCDKMYMQKRVKNYTILLTDFKKKNTQLLVLKSTEKCMLNV